MAMPGLAIPDDGGPWQAIVDQAAGPLAVLDLQGRYIYVNAAGCRMLGHDRDYLIGRNPGEFTHPNDPAVDRDAIDAVIAGQGNSFEVEKRYLRSDGTVIWALVINSLIRDPSGQPLFFFSQVHDISVRRETELLWQRTVANAPIGMALLDLKGYWTEVNDKLCDLLGYNRDELLSMHFNDLTYPDDSEQGTTVLADLLERRRDTVQLEKRYRHRDGYPIWMLIRSSVVPGADDSPAYLVSQYEAIGDERMQDRHLAHMALHDPLTGLANRALLLDRLHHGLAELSTTGGFLAVLVVDVNNLKPINDHYGHAVGDQLLMGAADELLNAVRADDTVARLGGDEFVVLSNVADSAHAEALRDRVTERLKTKIIASSHDIDLSASVGLAATGDPLASADALLHSADRDMYEHKKRSR